MTKVANWTYLPIPAAGLSLKSGEYRKGLGFADIEVFALRLSATGLCDAMDGSGVWHRVGRTVGYLDRGTPHEETVVSRLESGSLAVVAEVVS